MDGIVADVINLTCKSTLERIAAQCSKTVNDYAYNHETTMNDPFLKYKFFFERLNTDDLMLLFQMGKTLEREVWDNRKFLKDAGFPVAVALYDFNCTLNILKRNQKGVRKLMRQTKKSFSTIVSE